MPEPREVQISHMQWKVARAVLADGATDEAAGKRLFIAMDTVKTHLRKLYRRTQVGSRTELAIKVWSGQLDLINPAGHSLLTELEVFLRRQELEAV